jgi:hypothetical protein
MIGKLVIGDGRAVQAACSFEHATHRSDRAGTGTVGSSRQPGTAVGVAAIPDLVCQLIEKAPAPSEERDGGVQLEPIINDNASLKRCSSMELKLEPRVSCI